MAATKQDLADRFGQNLRRLRARVALSQEELARLSSLHRTEIGLLENGARAPRLDTLVKLASSLEVSPDDLLDGIEWVPSSSPSEGQFWTGTLQDTVPERGSRG